MLVAEALCEWSARTLADLTRDPLPPLQVWLTSRAAAASREMAALFRVLVLVAAACLSPTHAIVIEIFSDAACAISIGNSSIYTGYAGICNTATTPDSGLSIGIDFCSPTRVTMTAYRLFNPATRREWWGDSYSCGGGGGGGNGEVTMDLTVGVCTPVTPCATCCST